jgi:hypothetical protein
MPNINISDIAGMDLYKRILEDEKFAKLIEQLDDEQKAHVEQFVNEIRDVFMPSITNFSKGLNEMDDEQRKEFSENIKKMYK